LNIKPAILVILFGLLSVIIHAQHTGVLPSFTYKKKLHSFDIASTVMSQNMFIERNLPDIYHKNSDLRLLISFPAGISSKITAGVQPRITSDNRFILRTIQQFIITSEIRQFISAHRFALEQFLETHKIPEYRFRYRFSVQQPLKGYVVNTKELYLKYSMEFLQRFNHSLLQTEARLSAFLGFVPALKHKMEIGVDYRPSTKDYASFNDIWFLNINWYLAD
jgi:hypothetical protein